MFKSIACAIQSMIVWTLGIYVTKKYVDMPTCTQIIIILHVLLPGYLGSAQYVFLLRPWSVVIKLFTPFSAISYFIQSIHLFFCFFLKKKERQTHLHSCQHPHTSKAILFLSYSRNAKMYKYIL